MMSLPFPPNEIQILLHKATTVLFYLLIVKSWLDFGLLLKCLKKKLII